MNGSVNHTCAFCDAPNLFQFLDFGEVALAGAFLKSDQIADEQYYRLRIAFCEKCFGVQVVDQIPPSTLFSDYFYFSSAIGSLTQHFAVHGRNMVDRFIPDREGTVLEFGCNDGVLLKPIAEQGVSKVIGVDPASNVISKIDDDRIIKVNDFFTLSVAKKIVVNHGHADLIFANNVFAHISNINDTTSAVHHTLSSDGVFVFEVHYLGKILDELQYDMIYHEHIYYYSLLSAVEHLAKHGLVVFDAQEISVHGGSLRVFACRNQSKYATQVTSRVKNLIEKEVAGGFDRKETFANFGIKVEQTKNQLLELVRDLKAKGNKVAGYGASGRANTIIQYCDLGEDLLDYIVDDAPAKQGYITPGSHLPIVDRSVLLSADRPDYIVLFAWSFLDEVVEKNKDYFSTGGRIIVPLPEPKVLHTAAWK